MEAMSEKNLARVSGIISGSGPEPLEKEREADLGRMAFLLSSPSKGSVRPRVERSGSEKGGEGEGEEDSSWGWMLES